MEGHRLKVSAQIKLQREMTSQLSGLAPKDLLWGAKINNPAQHRFQRAKFGHRHFLPGKQESTLNPRGVWNCFLRSEILSQGAVAKPPGEVTHLESF